MIFNGDIPAPYEIEPLRDIPVPEQGRVELLGDLREGRVREVHPCRRHVHRGPEQLRYPHRVRALDQLIEDSGHLLLTIPGVMGLDGSAASAA